MTLDSAVTSATMYATIVDVKLYIILLVCISLILIYNLLVNQLSNV